MTFPTEWENKIHVPNHQPAINWGLHKSVGLFHGKSHLESRDDLKWMMTGGSPMTQETTSHRNQQRGAGDWYTIIIPSSSS